MWDFLVELSFSVLFGKSIGESLYYNLVGFLLNLGIDGWVFGDFWRDFLRIIGLGLLRVDFLLVLGIDGLDWGGFVVCWRFIIDFPNEGLDRWILAIKEVFLAVFFLLALREGKKDSEFVLLNFRFGRSRGKEILKKRNFLKFRLLFSGFQG